MLASKYGVIIEICDEFQNNTYRIYDDEEILIGRDSKQSQIVIRNPLISRRHCGVKFSVAKQCYYICEYHSTNGTSISGMGKIISNQWTEVPHNTLLPLANNRYMFLLV